jgi:hypothetical protein
MVIAESSWQAMNHCTVIQFHPVRSLRKRKEKKKKLLWKSVSFRNQVLKLAFGSYRMMPTDAHAHRYLDRPQVLLADVVIAFTLAD